MPLVTSMTYFPYLSLPSSPYSPRCSTPREDRTPARQDKGNGQVTVDGDHFFVRCHVKNPFFTYTGASCTMYLI
jgi:hypothetical protein